MSFALPPTPPSIQNEQESINEVFVGSLGESKQTIVRKGKTLKAQTSVATLKDKRKS